LQEIIFPFPFSLENDVIGTLVYGIANYQEEEKERKVKIFIRLTITFLSFSSIIFSIQLKCNYPLVNLFRQDFFPPKSVYSC
jgi:hypothetical protein